MKILSFDVGIINLAYCIFDSELNKIQDWGIIDLKVEGFSGKVPSGLNKNMAKAANDIHVTLIKKLDSFPILLNVDYVVIEKQPSFNPKMRIIGGCLQSYFYIRGIVDNPKITSIEFFSPKHKLKCYTGPELTIESKAKSKYTQTKKMGILIAQAKLDEFDESMNFKQLFEKSKKKDDLADCYLQAITFCLFKKFKVIESKNEIKNEMKVQQKILTKPQIKKQLKEYLDKFIKVYSISELLQSPIEKNLVQTFENMDSNLKESIKSKFKIENFTIENCNLILLDLSMKTYIYYHYSLEPMCKLSLLKVN
jgi:hypothetical protein